MNIQNRAILLSFFLLLCSFVTLMLGCREQKINSQWRHIDTPNESIYTEWEDSLAYYDEEADVALGIFNDAKCISLCLSVRDQKSQAQLIGHGLTVWFDPDGGKEKYFGFHFPVGMHAGRRESKREKSSEASGRRSKKERRKGFPDVERLQEMLEAGQNEIEIIGPEKEARQILLLADAGEMGVNARMEIVEGVLFYELRVPVSNDDGQASAIAFPSLNQKKRIGIGVEIAQAERKRMGKMMGRGRGGMGGPGGIGRPSGMGGRGGMGRGPREMGGPEGDMPEPFEFWAKVKLSKVSF